MEDVKKVSQAEKAAADKAAAEQAAAAQAAKKAEAPKSRKRVILHSVHGKDMHNPFTRMVISSEGHRTAEGKTHPMLEADLDSWTKSQIEVGKIVAVDIDAE